MLKPRPAKLRNIHVALADVMACFMALAMRHYRRKRQRRGLKNSFRSEVWIPEKSRDEERDDIVASSKADARAALSSFLQTYEWHAIVTSTNKDGARFARLAIDRTARVLLNFGVQRLYVAAEPHKLGNFHTHGLVYYGENASKRGDSLLNEYARDALARVGFCTVSHLKASKAASNYCAKYLTKQLADWDFYGDWQKGS